MNVFVLCTGRCGSYTFYEACKNNIDDFTVGHESQARVTGNGRLMYPINHIEIDNRLSWMLGRLDYVYGTRGKFVHLHRDPEKVARSFAKRRDYGIMKAYRSGIMQGAGYAKQLEVARDMVRTIEMNILHFLKDKDHHLVQIEKPETFDRWLEAMEFSGNLALARHIFRGVHNASES